MLNVVINTLDNFYFIVVSQSIEFTIFNYESTLKSGFV